MNEFIVWDKEIGVFIGEESFDSMFGFYSIDYRELKEGMTKEDLIINQGQVLRPTYMMHLERFAYIGKTDIEGNKIYADSSIVEFYSRLHGWQKGYFSYDCTSLSYRITLFNDMSVSFDNERETKFKITGTLQENPELLK